MPFHTIHRKHYKSQQKWFYMKGGKSVLMLALGTLREDSEGTAKWLLNCLKHDRRVTSTNSGTIEYFWHISRAPQFYRTYSPRFSPTRRQSHCPKRSHFHTQFALFNVWQLLYAVCSWHTPPIIFFIIKIVSCSRNHFLPLSIWGNGDAGRGTAS